MRRVVVTGMGLLSSIGNDINETWKNLIRSQSGIKKINHFDVSDLPAKIAAYINNNPDDEDYFNKNSILESRDIKRNDRFIQYGLVAAKMAIDDAGLNDLSDKDKFILLKLSYKFFKFVKFGIPQDSFIKIISQLSHFKGTFAVFFGFAD